MYSVPEILETEYVHQANTELRRLDFRNKKVLIMRRVQCKLTHLEVCSFAIEGDVNRECGGVMMWPQVRLSFGSVLHHKVHDGVSLNENEQM